MDFAEYYYTEDNDFLDKKVLHTTPSGARNHCKIKNLPPDEYKKWRDISLGKDRVLSPAQSPTITHADDMIKGMPHLVKFYYVPPSRNPERRYTSFLKGTPVKCTTNPSHVVNASLVVVADRVPLAAIVAYKDGVKWKAFRLGMNDELKFDAIGKYEWFRVNFYDFKDSIDFILSDAR